MSEVSEVKDKWCASIKMVNFGENGVLYTYPIVVGGGQ